MGGKENNPPGFKKNKDRVTVLVCANAAGTQRIDLLVIGKSKAPRAMRNQQLPDCIKYTNYKNAWMTREIFRNWFHNIFVPSVKERHGDDKQCLLILDNARCHSVTDEFTEGNIKTIFLPPHVTSILQPMDQAVIKSLKSHYKRTFIGQLLQQDTFSVADFQKNYTIKKAADNLGDAWLSITCSTLRNAWHKLWPSLGDIAEDESSCTLNRLDSN